MEWNWQQPDWPEFKHDQASIAPLEAAFLHRSGMLFGAFSHLTDSDQDLLRVELISNEAEKTSEIEGEYLDRDSLQSSIRRHFGLKTDFRKTTPAEAGITEMMVQLYRNHEVPLSHELLFDWHSSLMNGRNDLVSVGGYRKDESPMQVVSGPFHNPRVHFEAPPAGTVEKEMNRLVEWFNLTHPNSPGGIQPLTRAGIAHLYFESIHPFEDGNGRIGRALSEKALAQALGKPTLIALAAVIQKNRKEYYEALASANRDNEITEWISYFGRTILEAVETTQLQIEFLIQKTKLFDELRGKLNERQEKCLTRMFQEGLAGFKGGLSAANYMTITGATRPTTTRDLNQLVEMKALIKTGELKSTRYHLKGFQHQ